jgi:Rod binding domain-containing protein
MNLNAVNGTVMPNRSGASSEPRLIQTAHEFEGQMLKELLKPLTASDGTSGDSGGDDSGDGSGGILGEFAAEALGKALSERGGFGIADRIIGQLSHSGNRSGPAQVTGEDHFDNGMRVFKSLQ